MSKRIYIGNLPWSVTKVRLDELFSPFGEIEDSLVIANKFTGRSRGFGFVTYKKDSDADSAIKEMNKKEVNGRVLVVREAIPIGERKLKKETNNLEDNPIKISEKEVFKEGSKELKKESKPKKEDKK
ncbi:MAG: RNA-binding protein [Candidatus Pacearchaeota archaeon]